MTRFIFVFIFALCVAAYTKQWNAWQHLKNSGIKADAQMRYWQAHDGRYRCLTTFVAKSGQGVKRDEFTGEKKKGNRIIRTFVLYEKANPEHFMTIDEIENFPYFMKGFYFLIVIPVFVSGALGKLLPMAIEWEKNREK